MPGLKRLRNTAVTISGIALTHGIRNDQFNFTRLHLRDTAVPTLWKTTLPARWSIGEYVIFGGALSLAPELLVYLPRLSTQSSHGSIFENVFRGQE